MKNSTHNYSLKIVNGKKVLLLPKNNFYIINLSNVLKILDKSDDAIDYSLFEHLSNISKLKLLYEWSIPKRKMHKVLRKLYGTENVNDLILQFSSLENNVSKEILLRKRNVEKMFLGKMTSILPIFHKNG